MKDFFLDLLKNPDLSINIVSSFLGGMFALLIAKLESSSAIKDFEKKIEAETKIQNDKVILTHKIAMYQKCLDLSSESINEVQSILLILNEYEETKKISNLISVQTGIQRISSFATTALAMNTSFVSDNELRKQIETRLKNINFSINIIEIAYHKAEPCELVDSLQNIIYEIQAVHDSFTEQYVKLLVTLDS
ncbi:hypothetical protein JZO77_02965 [Enterococcus hulanensis]|uniref:hypothetical protein n=1 Tax=Enterococcus hulanensis TaxID=2559929 RepID=UPI001A8D5653|nr:hypothetical protein [Enterococcus hulanensis]MBO0455701.1 hypothetical protein [Enterococcus hulanensis]